MSKGTILYDFYFIFKNLQGEMNAVKAELSIAEIQTSYDQYRSQSDYRWANLLENVRHKTPYFKTRR